MGSMPRWEERKAREARAIQPALDSETCGTRSSVENPLDLTLKLL
jgi:hypothetical protein